jgi:hypothetical protein
MLLWTWASQASKWHVWQATSNKAEFVMHDNKELVNKNKVNTEVLHA